MYYGEMESEHHILGYVVTKLEDILMMTENKIWA